MKTSGMMMMTLILTMMVILVSKLVIALQVLNNQMTEYKNKRNLLWQQDKDKANKLKSLKYLVLIAVSRMNSHFKDQ